MNTAADLLKLWLEMLDATVIGNSMLFKNTQTLFNRTYKYVGYGIQGEFHALLAQNHKEAVL